MPHTTPVIGSDLRVALLAMVKKRVPESEAEDIVQATLADAFASPHAPNDAESFRRWIFGVAKNKVVDYHRRAGREILDFPEDMPGPQAPHQEADMLRWAERHLPPGEENKKTLDWMLREGEGEKLEWIAEHDNVPAPRVRQRVSRLRRHLKEHWQKEVAVLAALGVLMTALFLYINKKKDPGISNEDVARAEELRKDGLDNCANALWKDCVQKLDDAKKLDPAGDTKPEIKQARDNASKALTLPPVPSSNPTTTDITPPPAPTASDLPPMTKDPMPIPTTESTAMPPSPKKKAFSPSKPSPKPMSTEAPFDSSSDFGSMKTAPVPQSSATPTAPKGFSGAGKKSAKRAPSKASTPDPSSIDFGSGGSSM